MKNAIILHGKADPGELEYYNADMPASSNSHWLPWLQKQLFIRDIFAQTPEIPNSWKPDYRTWCKEFERYDITPETILVGHSCGGGFIVRWLSDHPNISVGKVVLVAPWIDPTRVDTIDFFDFTIDPQLASRCKKLTIFGADNHFESVQKSIAILRDKIEGVTYKEFHEYGHFCFNDMKTEKFPELLDALVS